MEERLSNVMEVAKVAEAAVTRLCGKRLGVVGFLLVFGFLLVSFNTNKKTRNRGAVAIRRPLAEATKASALVAAQARRFLCVSSGAGLGGSIAANRPVPWLLNVAFCWSSRGV